MHDDFVEAVYDTLRGVRAWWTRVPGVDNAFAEGSLCQARYSDMLRAYARLCDRLGVVDEDEDVEIIIGALLDIEGKLARRMFAYGVQFADAAPAPAKQE